MEIENWPLYRRTRLMLRRRLVFSTGRPMHSEVVRSHFVPGHDVPDAMTPARTISLFATSDEMGAPIYLAEPHGSSAMRCLVLSLVTLLLVTGCGERKARVRLETLEQNTERLFRNDTNLYAALDALQKRLKAYVDFQAFSAQQMSQRPFDLRDKGFAAFDTGSGMLFIAIDEITPEQDGFVLRARLGNPSSVTYSRVDITASWGFGHPPEFPGNQDVTPDEMQSWINAVKDKWEKMTSCKTEIVEPVEPGVWTPARISVRPATFADLEAVFLDVSVKSVLLRYKK